MHSLYVFRLKETNKNGLENTFRKKDVATYWFKQDGNLAKLCNNCILHKFLFSPPPPTIPCPYVLCGPRNQKICFSTFYQADTCHYSRTFVIHMFQNLSTRASCITRPLTCQDNAEEDSKHPRPSTRFEYAIPMCRWPKIIGALTWTASVSTFLN